MPASMTKSHPFFVCCLQGSNAGSADRRILSRAQALMFLAVLLAAANASAQERRIQLEDLTKIVTVSDPQISPDGKSIVCVVSRQNFDEDRSENELVLVDTINKDTTKKEDSPQVFVMPMSGGDAKKVTNAPQRG